MFPDLDPLAVDDGPLMELADAMTDPDPASADGNNTKVPAGFTYLGQFVDHDMTLDLTALGEKESDPTAVTNFRTPALDLDSVYGLGPDGSRQLFARNPGDADGKNPGPKLLVGKNINVAAGGVTGDHLNDLPMLSGEFAACVVAPDNAIPAVKELVRGQNGYVSHQPWGHGVARGLEHYLQKARSA